MSYQAPRQGMFAIIILLSLCLHVLFFVVSYESSARAAQEIVTTELAVNLTEEAVLPMRIDDRVGLSVLTAKVVAHPMVAHVAIYDAEGSLLVPAGNDVDVDSVSVTERIYADGQILGTVVVRPVPISRAGVFADYWLFLLMALVLHIFIWLVYGHVARPSDALIENISRDARDRLLDSGVLTHTQSTHLTQSPSQQSPSQEAPAEKTISKTVADMLKNRGIAKGLKPAAPMPVASHAPVHDADSTADNADANAPPSDTTDMLMVQVAFDDPQNLLAVLAQDRRDAYLALCNQLIDKSLTHALAQPILSGVQLQHVVPFSQTQKQAQIYLSKGEAHAQTALAAAMLVKLLVAINQVVYEKHRELSYFALPMKAIASHADEAQVQAGATLLTKRQEDAMLMLTVGELAQMKSHMSIERLPHPASIHERECGRIVSMSDGMMRKITALRNEILLS